MNAERPTESDRQIWSCPDCGWVEKAHPVYGWAKHNDGAVEVHKRALCPALTAPVEVGRNLHDPAAHEGDCPRASSDPSGTVCTCPPESER